MQVGPASFPAHNTQIWQSSHAISALARRLEKKRKRVRETREGEKREKIERVKVVGWRLKAVKMC